jgi:hypothetical protein
MAFEAVKLVVLCCGALHISMAVRSPPLASLSAKKGANRLLDVEIGDPGMASEPLAFAFLSGEFNPYLSSAGQ